MNDKTMKFKKGCGRFLRVGVCPQEATKTLKNKRSKLLINVPLTKVSQYRKKRQDNISIFICFESKLLFIFSVIRYFIFNMNRHIFRQYNTIERHKPQLNSHSRTIYMLRLSSLENYTVVVVVVFICCHSTTQTNKTNTMQQAEIEAVMSLSSPRL